MRPIAYIPCSVLKLNAPVGHAAAKRLSTLTASAPSTERETLDSRHPSYPRGIPHTPGVSLIPQGYPSYPEEHQTRPSWPWARRTVETQPAQIFVRTRIAATRCRRCEAPALRDLEADGRRDFARTARHFLDARRQAKDTTA